MILGMLLLLMFLS